MIKFILSVIAVVNLTEIMTEDKIFEPIREWAGITHDLSGVPMYFEDRFFAKLLWCFKCSSVWAAIFLTILEFTYKPAHDFFLKFLTVSWLAKEFSNRLGDL